MTKEERLEAASWVAEAVRTLLGDIRAETGWPAEVILSGAHAEVVTLLAMSVGGPVAASMAEQSADRVRSLPSLGAVILGMTPVAGSA
ncbi:hypothetical protein [Cereibacter sphaeroides]|uniref:hypothetical protein n=1 Tax=Cereibacter sphaeroides TaxID=1063 RepID=UPI00194F4F57